MDKRLTVYMKYDEKAVLVQFLRLTVYPIHFEMCPRRVVYG